MTRKIVVFSIVLILLLISYLKFISKKQDQNLISNENNSYNSNTLENIKYNSIDADGNEYIINAKKGEIDLNNSEIIFLENVNSLIKLENSEIIQITSDFGKYNTNNNDTIFSKSVVVTYLNNKINAEYLDFSLVQNRMIVSKNIVFTNEKNVLKADVIEVDLKTNDTKIFMHE